MKNKLNIIAALLVISAGSVFGGIPVPQRSPNGIILPQAINCDGTGTLEVDTDTLIVNCTNDYVQQKAALLTPGTAPSAVIGKMYFDSAAGVFRGSLDGIGFVTFATGSVTGSFVLLQVSTPGSPDSGNFNVSGIGAVGQYLSIGDDTACSTCTVDINSEVGGLNVRGTATNEWKATIRNTSGASTSYGLRTWAGTNASDTSLQAGDSTASTVFLEVQGDGTTGINDGSADARFEVKAAVADSFILAVTSQSDTTGDIMAVTRLGRVGIKNASPAATLEVGNSSLSHDGYYILATNDGTTRFVEYSTAPLIAASAAISLNAIHGGGMNGTWTINQNDGGDCAASFHTGGGLNTVTQIYDPFSCLEVSDTGSKFAAYFSVDTYYLKNRQGAGDTISLTFRGSQ